MVVKSQTLIHQRLQVSPAQIAEFCQHWQISGFALFGSVLRDDFRPDSDIDVLVTLSSHLGLSVFVEIQDKLEHLLQRDVDVVPKASIQESATYLRRQRILASAKIIYSADQIVPEPFDTQLELSGHFADMDRDQSLLLDIVLAGRKIQQ